MTGKQSRVFAVRQKGGDCIEAMKSKVRVEKVGGPVELVAEEDHNVRIEDRGSKMLERRAIAEVRGRLAEKKISNDKWIQEKLKKEEIERKESVKLMEMLRAARIACNPRIRQTGLDDENYTHFPQEICEDDPVDEKLSGSISSSKREGVAFVEGQCPTTNRSNLRNQSSSTSRTFKPTIKPLNPAKKPLLPTINNDVSTKSNSLNSDLNRDNVCQSISTQVQKEHQKQLLKLVTPVGPLDSTEEASCLSTIMEESEMMTPSKVDEVDVIDEPAKNMAELTKESLISPFAETNAQQLEVNSSDLEKVKELMSKVKEQGKMLESSQYVSVEGGANLASKNNPGFGNKYKINQHFVKRVLEFSSNSSSSSLSTPPIIVKKNKYSSYSRPQKLDAASSSLQSSATNYAAPTSKRANNVVNPFPIMSPIPQVAAITSNTGHPKNKSNEPDLRYYIEKLLTLRKEDVENLSLTSTPTPDNSENIEYKSLSNSSSTLSSTTTTVYEFSKTVQNQYRNTRQQLMSKLAVVSKNRMVRGQTEFSSFDLSSVDEISGYSSGTLSSIDLSVTQYKSM